MKKKVLLLFGTRPEAIKMAPLVKEFQKNSDFFESKVCVTAQHREMLDQVLDFFQITPDYDLNLMKANQTLFDITIRALAGIQDVLKEWTPDLIFVQGDTTTVLCGAIAGFYCRIPVAHLEAGLRSGDKLSPYPEEVNRILAGHIAHYHFTPTLRATQNLQRETITQNVHQVGNTVIDALLLGINILESSDDTEYKNFFKQINFNKRVILVTGHRRESFGEPFQNICDAIKTVAQKYNDVEFVYPMHLNPNVRTVVNATLNGLSNVHLIEPLNYPYLLWLMKRSHIVLTDSGGIQEEAPSLGKPVLVMRDVTERQEGVEAGTAKLVGTNKQVIIEKLTELLDSKEEYDRMSKAVNPYGDGTTSQQIVEILKKSL